MSKREQSATRPTSNNNADDDEACQECVEMPDDLPCSECYDAETYYQEHILGADDDPVDQAECEECANSPYDIPCIDHYDLDEEYVSNAVISGVQSDAE